MCEYTVSCLEKKQKNNVERQVIIKATNVHQSFKNSKLAQNTKSQDYS